MNVETDAVNEMKSSLSKDSERCLNFFTCEPADGILGFAAFPWDLAAAPEIDGVVLHHASLPDAARPLPNWPFNLGMTAVHEVGHWTGLYHTFQDGCERPATTLTTRLTRRGRHSTARLTSRRPALAKRASTPSRITWTTPTTPA